MDLDSTTPLDKLQLLTNLTTATLFIDKQILSIQVHFSDQLLMSL